MSARRRQPVKVTAWLCSPLAGEPPMLDGLLEFYMLRHMPRIKETSGGHRHMHRSFGGYNCVPIPIARDMVGGWLIPRCSSPIIPTPDSEYTQKFARPMVVDSSLIAERKKLNTSSGPNKSCLLPLRCRLVDRIVWFAVAEHDSSRGRNDVRKRGSGSPAARLRHRLKKIGCVGSKVAHGYGEVERWEVDPIDDDWSWFAPSEDGAVLMRPLPIGDWLPDNLCGSRLDFDRPCGPYHDKSHACEVVKPC